MKRKPPSAKRALAASTPAATHWARTRPGPRRPTPSSTAPTALSSVPHAPRRDQPAADAARQSAASREPISYLSSRPQAWIYRRQEIVSGKSEYRLSPERQNVL